MQSLHNCTLGYKLKAPYPIARKSVVLRTKDYLPQAGIYAPSSESYVDGAMGAVGVKICACMMDRIGSDVLLLHRICGL